MNLQKISENLPGLYLVTIGLAAAAVHAPDLYVGGIIGAGLALINGTSVLVKTPEKGA
jgi:hypothetical protein